MAKQRNSLGVLVLPGTNSARLSWNEYKELTGIDLGDLFLIGSYESGGDTLYFVHFKPKCSKLIALSADAENSEGMPAVSFPTEIEVTENTAANSALYSLSVRDKDGSIGYYLAISADKHIEGGGL